MTLQPGSRPVPNYPDYVLIRKLGAGAFGEVWQACGPGGLDVALKFIRLDPHVRAVELRSLEVMKSIRHPNLVSLFGAWHKDNWLILAMELCDRSLLDRLLEVLEQNQPSIPLKELLSYMTDAANGLDALNAKQVQHRDVKPANLLLLDSGVKVADFGLAKALEQSMATSSNADESKGDASIFRGESKGDASIFRGRQINASLFADDAAGQTGDKSTSSFCPSASAHLCNVASVGFQHLAGFLAR
jgi:serine/threonine protein kinase